MIPRRHRTRRWAVPAVLLGFLALAGCRSSGADDRVTIQFWGMGREGEVVAELVRDFERAHPGIRVQVQQMPWTAAHEKLLTAHVGDATPDVAQLGNTWIAEFETLDALEPLGARVASSDAMQPDDFFRGIWNTNVVDGEVYGVPWYVDTRVIFYRTDILAAAGYEAMPTTWTEWREALRAVKRHVGPDRWAIFLPTNEWAQPVIFGLQAGSPILADGGRRGAFSDAEFRRGFEFYVGLYREGLAPPIGTTQMSNVFQEFARGTFAMYITGPWNLGEFRRRLPAELQDRWSTAPLPGPDGAASGVSLAGGSSLVLFRSSPHKSEAWQLIEFLSHPDQQRRFFELTGNLPSRRETWQKAALIGDERARAFWEQLQRVEPLPMVPEIELIVTRVFDHAEPAIRGHVGIEQALAGLDADVNRILEKRRWMLDRAARR